MRAWLVLAIALAAIVVACGDDDDDGAASPTPAGAVVFTSDAFSPGGEIPLEFSCDGDNVSPPLSWSGLPEGAQSLTLTMDDLDAGGYVHWVMYDIPPGTMGLAANVPMDETLADGSTQGVNSGGEVGYAGPCPPSGEHRYRFRLYALDAEVDLEAGATLADVEAAIADHVLAQSELVGTFSR